MGTYVGGGECEPDGVGSAGAADGVSGGAGFGGGGLEAGDLRAEDELLGGADGFDGVEELLPDGGELAGEVEHWDGLEGGGCDGLRGVMRHRGMVYRPAARSWRGRDGGRSRFDESGV